LPRSHPFGRISTGAGLTLVGLALVAAGVVGVIAVAGRWVPLRALIAARGPAPAMLYVLLGVGLLVFLVGLTIYVLGPTRSREAAAAGYARLPTVLATLAIGTLPANVLALVILYAAGQISTTGPPTPVVLLGSIIPLDVCLLLALYVRIVRPGVLSWRDLGMSTRQLGTHVGEGAGAFLLLIFGVGVVNLILRFFGVQQTQEEAYLGVRGATGLQFAALVLAAGVLAPIAEESFFRGYVFGAYLRTQGRMVAYLLSAGLFAVVHLNLPAAPALFAVGLLLAALRDLTKSLIPGIVAHGLNNSFAFAVLYFASGLPLPR
jgi:CAAX protease family protein